MHKNSNGSVILKYHDLASTASLIAAVFFCMCFQLGVAPVYAEEVSIGLVADSYIDRDYPDDNYGGSAQLDAHYGIVGTTPDGHAHYVIRQILLQFNDVDLTAIPDGANIISARLEAYLDSGDANTHVFIDVGYVTQAWDEMSVTWSSLAEHYAWPRSPRITTHVDTTAGWVEWDVTRIVRNWRTGLYAHHGFIMMIYVEPYTPIEDYSRLFYSKEGDLLRAPKLTVEYTLEPIEPTVDLTITNLEINQVVQVIEDPTTPTPGSDNSVALIAEKPTIVRLYVDTGPATEPVHGVTAYLYRVVDGIEERLTPLNPIIAVTAPDRENHHHTINFRLPTDWLLGDLNLYAVINPSTLSMRVPETNYDNNRFPAGDSDFVSTTFEAEGRDTDIAWLKLNYTWAGWGGAPMASDRVGHQSAANFIRMVFPVPGQNVSYRPWPGGGFNWDTDINASYTDLINELNDIYDLSTATPKPDFLYAWIPELSFFGVGLSNPPFNGGEGIVAFGEDRDPNMLYRVIFTHELGHNLNQIGHGSFPNPRLTNGEYGYDVLNVDLLSRVVMRHYVDDSMIYDLIDYMQGGTPPAIWDGNWAWVTPYTYNGVHTEMTASGFFAPLTWYRKNIYPLLRLHKIETKRIHEAKIVTDLKPKTAKKVLVVSGTIAKRGAGSFRPLYVLNDQIYDLSQGDGAYSVELLDRNKKTISTFQFNVNFYIDNYAGKKVKRVPFKFVIPYPEGVKFIELKHGRKVYDRVKVSKNPPQVEIIYPDVKTQLTGGTTVKWKGYDADGDTLMYSILYSRDGAKTWWALATGIKETRYTLQSAELPGGDNVFIRIMATDGVNTAMADTAAPVIVEDKSPTANILEPRDKTRLVVGTTVVLMGQGYDLEDGMLSGKSLRWLSNKDGTLGVGRKVEVKSLSQGVHEIALIATDNTGNKSKDTITIYVDRDWFNPKGANAKMP